MPSSTSSSPDVKAKLVKILQSELSSRYTPQNVQNALREVIKSIQDNKVLIYEPDEIEADIVYEIIGSFKYFRCPKCGRIYSFDEAQMYNFKCRDCHVRLVQAYVGAPVNFGARIVHREQLRPGAGNESSTPFILDISSAHQIRCSWLKGRQGLKVVVVENPGRPISSLTYKCPWKEEDRKSCPNYRDGYCVDRDGRKMRLFFPPIGGIKRIPSLPSEAFTKPYTKSVFNEVGDHEVMRELMERELEGKFNEVSLGKFSIWGMTMFYLLGNAYAPRAERLVVIATYDDFKVFIGRKMVTEGALFKLNWNRIKRVIERLKNVGLNVDEYIVAHSVAHVLMKSLVSISGLSYAEFGESIYIDADEEVAEVLIYDDSPGGIGGVRAIRQAPVDFAQRVMQNSDTCPRSCTMACRACLYLENCGSLNFNLSWMAANYYFRL